VLIFSGLESVKTKPDCEMSAETRGGVAELSTQESESGDFTETPHNTAADEDTPMKYENILCPADELSDNESGEDSLDAGNARPFQTHDEFEPQQFQILTVSSPVRNKDVDEPDLMEDSNVYTSNKASFHSIDNASTGSENSSIDEMDDTSFHYTYDVTPDPHNYRNTSHSPQPNVLSAECSTADDAYDLTENENDNNAAIMPAVGFSYSDDIVPIATAPNKKTSAGVNEAAKKKVSQTSPAELLAPHLAQEAILEGIKEVTHRPAEKTAGSDHARSTVDVVEQSDDYDGMEGLVEESPGHDMCGAGAFHTQPQPADWQAAGKVLVGLDYQEGLQSTFAADNAHAASNDLRSTDLYSTSSSQTCRSSVEDLKSSLAHGTVAQSSGTTVSEHSDGYTATLQPEYCSEANCISRKSPEVSEDTLDVFAESTAVIDEDDSCCKSNHMQSKEDMLNSPDDKE